MPNKPAVSTEEESYGPIEIDRRTLTKIAGMASVTVVTGGRISGAAIAETNTTMVKIQPTFDNVLIQEVNNDQNGTGPSKPRDATREGIVRATGNNTEEVGEGDKVKFLDDVGIEVASQGEDYVVVEEQVIFAIIED